LRGPGPPLEAVRALLRSMARAAYGVESPPATEASLADLRAHDAGLRALPAVLVACDDLSPPGDVDFADQYANENERRLGGGRPEEQNDYGHGAR